MSSRPGKTAPRLLQDLLTYDPRHEVRAGRNILTDPPEHHDPDAAATPAIPFRNCRHIPMLKFEQSLLPEPSELPTHETIYKISTFCINCHWHIELTVDFRDNGSKKTPCRRNTDFPLHHFISVAGNSYPDPNTPKNFHFQCSAPQCPVDLYIRMYPPRLKPKYIELMTSRIRLKMRLEAAKGIDFSRTGGADDQPARPVDALNYLSTYLQDSLQPKQGKTRIPLLNRKFLKTFGKDCDELLLELGFTRETEDEDGTEIFVWCLPKPPPARNPLEPANERTLIEDVRYELAARILALPESDKANIRHPIQPHPASTELEMAIGASDYDRRPMARTEARNAGQPEDHPYYAGLGSVGDFSDALLLFAYARQVAVDLANSTYYFECLQSIAIGRESQMLGEHVQILASQGQSNRKEVIRAYSLLGIDPNHVSHLSDEIIIGQFKARLADISPSMVEESRNALRIIGAARQSERIIQEASNAIETYEQALSWLDLDQGQPDDFVQAMYTIKAGESAANKANAIKAVQIIAQARKSRRLLDFLNTGNMDAAEMDVAEAYVTLGVQDRSSALDLDVLRVQMEDYKQTTPQNASKYEQAFELIRQDQHQNHQNTGNQDMGPPRKRHAMESWPVGCQNIGNTCYLNSVLQFLFTIKPLREMVLNFEQYSQEITPEALETKRVGRSAVTTDKVQRAQDFVLELRKLFNTMITAPSESVRPPTKLACLALLKDYSPVEESTVAPGGNSGLGIVEGIPVQGPMPNPTENIKSEAGGFTLPESAMDADKKSDTSSTVALADPDEEKFITEEPETKNVDDIHFSGDPNPEIPAGDKPEPPSRPPPVPPRPQAGSASYELQVVEEVARQQDAAEILNNVFDLLSCAMKGDGVDDDGEQIDLIKRLFFFQVRTVMRANGATSDNLALQDHQLIYPGDRDRHLYAALDDEFGLQEIEADDAPSATSQGGNIPKRISKYESLSQASPILIVNVRRADYKDGRAKKNEHHVGLDDILYLDRYLQETRSLSTAELLQRREEQWGLTQKLRELEARKTVLTETGLEPSGLGDVVEEAATYVESVTGSAIESSKAGGASDSGISDLPQLLQEGAKRLEQDAKGLDEQMKEIDAQISSLFADCKDHPYRLHSVFIHRGSAAGGHYWIYIHDFENKIWRKYNDERVDEVEDLKDIFTQEDKYPATSTGIVYVRDDLVGELTEAVHRKPASPDVEMKDAVDEPKELPNTNSDASHASAPGGFRKHVDYEPRRPRPRGPPPVFVEYSPSPEGSHNSDRSSGSSTPSMKSPSSYGWSD